MSARYFWILIGSECPSEACCAMVRFVDIYQKTSRACLECDGEFVQLFHVNRDLEDELGEHLRESHLNMVAATDFGPERVAAFVEAIGSMTPPEIVYRIAALPQPQPATPPPAAAPRYVSVAPGLLDDCPE